MNKGRTWESPDALFGALISSMGGSGDKGNVYPQSDADDLASGARFVSGEVTLARRKGDKVPFIQNCSPCCWYWQMPDGSRIYHFSRTAFEEIAAANGKVWKGEFHGDSGPCPKCGNTHTAGGTVKADQIK